MNSTPTYFPLRVKHHERPPKHVAGGETEVPTAAQCLLAQLGRQQQVGHVFATRGGQRPPPPKPTLDRRLPRANAETRARPAVVPRSASSRTARTSVPAKQLRQSWRQALNSLRTPAQAEALGCDATCCVMRRQCADHGASLARHPRQAPRARRIRKIRHPLCHCRQAAMPPKQCQDNASKAAMHKIIVLGVPVPEGACAWVLLNAAGHTGSKWQKT